MLSMKIMYSIKKKRHANESNKRCVQLLRVLFVFLYFINNMKFGNLVFIVFIFITKDTTYFFMADWYKIIKFWSIKLTLKLTMI